MPEEIIENPQPIEPMVESKSADWPKIILAAVLGLGLLAGAAYAGYWYGTQQVQQPEKPTPVVSQPTPTPTVEDETKDWKTYIAPKFSIKYPNTWTLGVSVFTDEGGKKIAEFSPGHITPKEEVSCNEVFERVINGGPTIEAAEINIGFESPVKPEVVKQEKIPLGGMKLNLLVTKTTPTTVPPVDEPKPWYPHKYCIEGDGRLFLMNFYERSMPAQNEDLFLQILSTFKFLN